MKKWMERNKGGEAMRRERKEGRGSEEEEGER